MACGVRQYTSLYSEIIIITIKVKITKQHPKSQSKRIMENWTRNLGRATTHVPRQDLQYI